LFDGVEENQEVEFTEDDLKKGPEETPTKALNPYDSELSATIGKNKANRKQINTSEFRLQDKDEEIETGKTTATSLERPKKQTNKKPPKKP
jgi:hypothetical protein